MIVNYWNGYGANFGANAKRVSEVQTAETLYCIGVGPLGLEPRTT